MRFLARTAIGNIGFWHLVDYGTTRVLVEIIRKGGYGFAVEHSWSYREFASILFGGFL